MEFEVFDKKSEKHYASQSMIIRVDEKQRRVRINQASIEGLKLQEEMYVKFLRFGKTWYIVATTDASGYTVQFNSGERNGAKIGAAIVTRNILQDYKTNETSASFYLLETAHEQNGYPVFELLPAPKEK